MSESVCLIKCLLYRRCSVVSQEKYTILRLQQPHTHKQAPEEQPKKGSGKSGADGSYGRETLDKRTTALETQS